MNLFDFAQDWERAAKETVNNMNKVSVNFKSVYRDYFYSDLKDYIRERMKEEGFNTQEQRKDVYMIFWSLIPLRPEEHFTHLIFILRAIAEIKKEQGDTDCGSLPKYYKGACLL